MVAWEESRLSALDWDALVKSLGGNHCQHYAWGEMRLEDGWLPLRLLCKSENTIIGLASILVKRKGPLVVCWIPSGPIGSVEIMIEPLTSALKGILKTSFLYCRMALPQKENASLTEHLKDARWHPSKSKVGANLTMHYSLGGNAEERLQKASKNWRRNLKRSSQRELAIVPWEQPDVSELFELYAEMEAFKALPAQYSKRQLEGLFRHFGNSIYMCCCRDDQGKLLAARACLLCGEYALDLLAVAGVQARKLYASHALLWDLLNYCSLQGLAYYDLGGVDPENNQGVYDFKKGTGAAMVKTAGEWEWSSIPSLRAVVNRLLAHRR